jgi:hypothetical protein
MDDTRPTLAVIYGWAEGPWHAKRLIQATESSFRITQDTEQADIILAHSVGCYLIPKQANAKVVLLIGVPYWPGKPLIFRIWQKLVSDLKAHHNEGEVQFWIAKTVHNVWYVCRFLPRSISMMRAQIRHNFYSGSGRVVALRNQDDPFCDPISIERIARKQGWKYLSTSGIHDECWLKPDTYLQLLKDTYA